MDAHTSNQFWLLDYLVDPVEGTVTIGNGEVRQLQKKPMQVLAVLAGAQGRVVPGDQIIDRVWGNRSGGDEGLKRCIHAIRKALDDSSAHPKMIRTVRGRGYACVPLPKFDGSAALEPAPRATAVPADNPVIELNHQRTVTVVSVVLCMREAQEPERAGELFVPVPLLREFLEILQSFENAQAYDLGIMSTIIFGLNKTCDDDQVAAVELASALLQATKRLSGLGARIGIATETITVQTLERFSQPIALNMGVVRAAAGLAATAALDDISLCQATAELRRGASRGAEEWAQRETQGPGQAHADGQAGVNPVGRESEFESLLAGWSRVSVGEGQVVFLSGDAGIGKTSLCARLARQLRASQPKAVVKCYCEARSSGMPLHPIVRCVSELFGLEQEADVAGRGRLLEERVRQLGFAEPLAARVLADFLRLDVPGSRRVAEPGPGMRRNLLIEVLSRALVQVSEQPRLLVFEDIHWADPATLELLGQLVDRGPIARLMLLVTGRSEARPAWINRSHVTHINLRELGDTHVREIIRQLDPAGALGEATVERIVEIAAGNPYFLTEATMSALEHGKSRSVGMGLLSNSVRQVLLSRVDGLGAERDALRYASVIGPHFDLDSLQALMGAGLGDIEDSLKRLCDADMVHRVSSYPSAAFAFHHGLLHAAVYESIPESNRRDLHLQLAEHIENSSARVEKDFLAYHFEAAGQSEKAARYWLQAANRAKQHSLFDLAQRHYQSALDALEALPLSVGRDELEVQVRIEFGPVLMAQMGYAHEEVKANYLRAERLIELLAGRGSEVLPQALFGLWTYRVVNGDLLLARGLGEEMFATASRYGDRGLEMEANIMLGVALTHMGEFDQALARLHTAIAIYDPKRHADHKLLFGQDPGMAANVYCGVAFGELGDAGRSGEYLERGLAIARGSDHLPTLCFALTLAARHALATGDLELAAWRAREALDIATINGFPIWIAMSTFLADAVRFAESPSAEAAESMALSREMCRLAGHFLSYLDFSCNLAHAYLDIGDLERAEAVLADAKAEVDRRVNSAEARAVSALQDRLVAMKHQREIREAGA